jgi:FKBP-type peptidyl-prolyl cis-trans isomerase
MNKVILALIILAILLIAIGGYFLVSSRNSYEVEGVKIQVLKQGSGDQQAEKGNIVNLHYAGTLKDGQKFDSSYDRNSPFSFVLDDSRVIKGFYLGVLGMKVGEKRKITIPPDLGYGSVELFGIPANSTLVYEIELLAISQAPADTQQQETK